MEHWKNTSLENLKHEFNGVVYDEAWKDVVGGKGFYKISSFGRVKSCERQYVTQRDGFDLTVTVNERIRKQTLNHKGYPRMDMWINKKQFTSTTHRHVAKAFHKNPLNKIQVNHLDFDKRNNFYLNLEWATSKEDADHVRKNNRIKLRYGKDHHNSIPVVALTLDGIFIRSFDCAKEASDFTRVSRSYICRCCQNGGEIIQIKTNGRHVSYRFMYLDAWAVKNTEAKAEATAEDEAVIQPAIAQQNALDPTKQKAPAAQ